MKTLLATLLFSITCLTQNVFAHCQIPCGIYDDHAKVKEMMQDAETIKKATIFIAELSDKDDPQSQNQRIRWIMNKEKHAQNIISTISDYYLTQRVKASQKDYPERLMKHHAVIVAAMKAKQHADTKFAIELTDTIKAIAPYYPEHTH